MAPQGTKKKAGPITWKVTQEKDGTWIAALEALDLTVQLVSDSQEEQINEIVEVMQMVLESLNEKGLLFEYLKERGLTLRQVNLSGSGKTDCQVLPLPMNFSSVPVLSSAGA